LNIPLGVAVVEQVIETGMPCIAHHHDFYWERERFIVNAADDYLSMAFPPQMPQMQHVAINTQAAEEFSRRTGLSCRVIPNVMDFDSPPGPPDRYSRDFRDAIGLSRDDILILQPTRVVQRKGIEHAIELVHQLKDPRCKLVITHASGDEGDAYARRVRRYAEIMGVQIVFADEWIFHERGTGPDGRRRYTVGDAYQHADFVTYPSTYEGFGNAFLEAVYYRKPILCNRYAIYRTDIEPCGFDVILMDGFLTDETVEEVKRILSDEEYRKKVVDHNYEAASRFFSYRRVHDELLAILAKPALTPPSPRRSAETT
jgi:glycosyltransferase involved in cell wall biosynthesis